MSKIPPPIHATVSRIDAYHQARQDPPRAHLGPSQMGDEDQRGQWLRFRWAFEEAHSGRLLRLFRRGHLEEHTVVSDLRAIGCELAHVLDDQLVIDYGAHIKGSPDGIILSGLPEAPNKPHMLEIKTASRKRFEEMRQQGVERSNPTYWVQAHTYMYGLNNHAGIRLDRCMFIAVCKDDDSIYTERIEYDTSVAERYLARGRQVTMSRRMPEPTYLDPAFYRARWSPFYAAYFPRSATDMHMDRLRVQREGEGLWARVGINCRTCEYVEPLESGEWRCNLYASEVPPEFQRQGCDRYEMHGDIVRLIEQGNNEGRQ